MPSISYFLQPPDLSTPEFIRDDANKAPFHVPGTNSVDPRAIALQGLIQVNEGERTNQGA